MNIQIITLLYFAFFTKHFLVDFCFQPPYQYMNKGKLFHLGGILHSFNHAFWTFIIISLFVAINIRVNNDIIYKFPHFVSTNNLWVRVFMSLLYRLV